MQNYRENDSLEDLRSNMDKSIFEPSRSIPVSGHGDVIVCGAGPAGIAAAIAAARCGAKTRLIELHGCLGGVWTAGMLAWLFEMDRPGITREITGILDQRGARQTGNRDRYAYDVEAMKILLEELCIEAGIEIHLHTRLAGVTMSGQRIDTVLTESKSGREAWSAGNFIDCTGDGDLAAMAGCQFEIGRPQDGQCQPMTFMAMIAVEDIERVSSRISFWNDDATTFDNHLAASRQFHQDLKEAGVQPSYAVPTLFQVNGNLLALMVNHEYGVSAIDARQVTEATLRARAEINRVVNGLEKFGGIWRGTKLVATCEHIGVREARRIRGHYTVSESDLRTGARHPDGVCRARGDIDVHCPNPAEGKGQEVPAFRSKPYDIPLRALVAKGVDNLMMAGRCISGDFIAHSSYRLTGTAAGTGQVAGCVAALSSAEKKPPLDLNWDDIYRTLVSQVWHGESEVE